LPRDRRQDHQHEKQTGHATKHQPLSRN
jgi:hypothetical protein